MRLLPTAYLCIVAWFVAAVLFDPERLAWLVQDAAGRGLLRLRVRVPGGPRLRSTRWLRRNLSIDQFWSLAVEEQFYLVIGITVLVAIRRNWMKQLAVIMVAMALWIGWQRWTGNTGPWPGGPTNSSVPARGLSLLWLSRPDSLMWGVALAVLNAYLPELNDRWKRWLPKIAAVSLFVFFFTMLMASGVPQVGAPTRSGLPFPYVPMQPPIVDGKVDGTGGAVLDRVRTHGLRRHLRHPACWPWPG